MCSSEQVAEEKKRPDAVPVVKTQRFRIVHNPPRFSGNYDCATALCHTAVA